MYIRSGGRPLIWNCLYYKRVILVKNNNSKKKHQIELESYFFNTPYGFEIVTIYS